MGEIWQKFGNQSSKVTQESNAEKGERLLSKQSSVFLPFGARKKEEDGEVKVEEGEEEGSEMEEEVE